MWFGVVFAGCGSLLGLRLLCDCWLVVVVWMFGLWLCGCVGVFVLFVDLLFVLDNSDFVFECGWDTFWFGLLLGCVAVVDWFWVLGLVVGGFWFCVWAVLLFGALWF